MSIGSSVRKSLGHFEKPISNLYRSFFLDISCLAHQIALWVNAYKILELGCGEGALIECLSKEYPDAELVGIDISSEVGRMFNGDGNRVKFRQQRIEDFVQDNFESFDLIVISDVIHHVPWEMHDKFIKTAKKVVKPGGYMVLKDWEFTYTPIYLLGYLSDRFITGDKVRFKTRKQMEELISRTLGLDSIIAVNTIPPWKNNMVFLIRI